FALHGNRYVWLDAFPCAHAERGKIKGKDADGFGGVLVFFLRQGVARTGGRGEDDFYISAFDEFLDDAFNRQKLAYADRLYPDALDPAFLGPHEGDAAKTLAETSPVTTSLEHAAQVVGEGQYKKWEK